MIKNYFLITVRNLMKNKLFILINLFGLSIAIACCIVAYFNYNFNQSFDNNHVNAASVYRVGSVREFQNEKKKYGYVPMGLGNAVKQNIPEAEEVVRYSPAGANFRIDEELFNEGYVNVDPAFFKVFTFEFIEGKGDLEDKTKIVINDEMAKKYFGNEPALGKTITQMLDSGKTRDYVIGGVFKKQPANSSFGSSAYVNFYNQFDIDKQSGENNWTFRSTLFLLIRDPSRVASIAAQLKPYAENNNKVREDFLIQEFEVEPFVGMALRDEYNNGQGRWTMSAAPIAAVIGTGMMGIFVLLIACFNLTNTSIAISSKRLKEIGIRKVMGGMRKHLILQFMGETLIICFVSLLLGILVAEVALIPAFNELWPEMKLDPDYFGKSNFLLVMIGILLFTGILAGSYPAIYISSFQPVSILKGKVKFGGTNFFTRTLLTLQFAISLIAIVCSIAFIENAKYQEEFDLGFNKTGVVYTYVANRAEYETYRNALAVNDDIAQIAGSEHHLYSNYYNDPIKSGTDEIEVDIMNVGDDYVKTIGFSLVEGRDFTKDSETDRKESVIVTETLARKFGWTQAVGKEIIWMDTVKLYVVGVVKDVYNRGMWDELQPMMLRYGDKDKITHILISASADKVIAINKFMEKTWKEIFPNRLYDGRIMNETMVEAVTVNRNIVKMSTFLGIIALILSATGLFTMVSLNIVKKMKEIGVRKVLGASATNLSYVINMEFVIILCLASLLGCFAGAWISDMLMNSIWDYYRKVTVITLIISAAILFVVSVISIGSKVARTLRLNPSHVLRDE
jgi:putative ABC transport system permease protein